MPQPEHRPADDTDDMTRRPLFSVFAIVLALAMAACGGSGSSGFDAELQAINRALETGMCAVSEMLEICPADTTDVLPGGAEVETSVAGGSTVPCTDVLPPGPQCVFEFDYAPRGFPPEAEFRLAVRTTDGARRWTVTAMSVNQGTPTDPHFDNPVLIPDPEFDAAGRGVQIAVLVFLEPPVSVPTTVTLLADTGADFAFVTADLSAEVGD